MSATTVSLAIELTLQILMRAQQNSSLIAVAQSQGRTQLTPEEWAVITGSADDSRAALVGAIAKASD